MNFYEIRRDSVVPPSLRRRVHDWIVDKTDAKITPHNENEYYAVLRTATARSGDDTTLEVKIYPSAQWIKSYRRIVASFEQEVLRGTDYQYLDHEIRDYSNKSDLVVIYIWNPKARTEPVDKPRYLYHVTSESNEDRIMQKGLAPRAGPGDYQHLYYGPRVYLLADEDHAWEAGRIGGVGGVRKGQPWIIVRVDTNIFNRFRIFTDNEFAKVPAVWTPTHIPSHALEVIYRSTEGRRRFPR